MKTSKPSSDLANHVYDGKNALVGDETSEGDDDDSDAAECAEDCDDDDGKAKSNGRRPVESKEDV